MTLHIPWGVKYFVEIVLCRTIPKKNAFLCFKQNLKMAVKNGGKTIFWQKVPDDSAHTQGFKIRVFTCGCLKISLTIP